jgi:hypothetical protein
VLQIQYTTFGVSLFGESKFGFDDEHRMYTPFL